MSRCFLLRKGYRRFVVTVFVSFIIGIAFGLYLSSSTVFNQSTALEPRQPGDDNNFHENQQQSEQSSRKNLNAQVPVKLPSLKLQHPPTLEENMGPPPPPNYNVHTFYYSWYGNPKMNAGYIHWNHQRLPHWVKSVADKYLQTAHQPPDDIGSNYYPALGLYSSSDSSIIHRHMKMIRSAGIGVLVLSWYHPKRRDQNGVPTDHLVTTFLNIAKQHKIEVSFHLEPYAGRTMQTVLEDLTYIAKSYSEHPAVHRRKRRGSSSDDLPLPVVYIYDSYLIGAGSWVHLLGEPPEYLSIRGTSNDVFAVGLLHRREDCVALKKGGFDAGYTYFATEANSWASTSSNWVTMTEECRAAQVPFYPSFGPGYVDTAVRPWNSVASVPRRRGAFYRRQFWRAMRAGPPPVLGISTFNEWHEGTQIEPAVPKKTPDFTYLSYEPNQPDFYLRLTRRFVETYDQLLHFHNVTIPADEVEN